MFLPSLRGCFAFRAEIQILRYAIRTNRRFQRLRDIESVGEGLSGRVVLRGIADGHAEGRRDSVNQGPLHGHMVHLTHAVLSGREIRCTAGEEGDVHDQHKEQRCKT